MDPATPDAPWGKAVVRRSGTDLTVVTYSKMVLESLAAAEQLAAQGVSAEVIDLRTLNPLDDETVAASVRRTHRARVVTEAHLTGGFSADGGITTKMRMLTIEGAGEPGLFERLPLAAKPQR